MQTLWRSAAAVAPPATQQHRWAARWQVMATSFDRVHSSEEPQYFDMLKVRPAKAATAGVCHCLSAALF